MKGGGGGRRFRAVKAEHHVVHYVLGPVFGEALWLVEINQLVAL